MKTLEKACEEILKELLIQYPELVEEESHLNADLCEDIVNDLRASILKNKTLEHEYIRNDWGK